MRRFVNRNVCCTMHNAPIHLHMILHLSSASASTDNRCIVWIEMSQSVSHTQANMTFSKEFIKESLSAFWTAKRFILWIVLWGGFVSISILTLVNKINKANHPIHVDLNFGFVFFSAAKHHSSLFS